MKQQSNNVMFALKICNIIIHKHRIYKHGAWKANMPDAHEFDEIDF